MRRTARRGFTLIELLIVIVIVTILVAIAIPQFTGPRLAFVVPPDSIVATGATGPLTVQVTGRDDEPRRGVPVLFEVAGGNGTVSPVRVYTDTAGLATARWSVGPAPGVTTFVVTLEGRSRPRLTASTRAVEVAVPPAPPAPIDTAADTSALADTVAPRVDSAAAPPRGTLDES